MIFVSAHAIIRWLERVERFDFSATRSIIIAAGHDPNDSAVLSALIARGDGEIIRIARDDLTRPHIEAMHALGCRRIPIGNGLAAVFENDWVVTVAPIAKERLKTRRRPADFREMEEVTP